MTLVSCSLSLWERAGVRASGLKPRAAVFAWLLLCMAALAPAHALQLTDDRGVSVTLAQSPQRIVSLLPSLTESICALGECQRLVGVDRYSNSPASVKSLPVVGGVYFLVFLVDYLWPLWDDKRQALHDKVAQTQVVMGKQPKGGAGPHG